MRSKSSTINTKSRKFPSILSQSHYSLNGWYNGYMVEYFGALTDSLQKQQPELQSIELALQITRCYSDGVKSAYAGYDFPTDDDEICFFKFLQPQIAGRLMCYSWMIQSIHSCPNGDKDEKQFWEHELKRYDRICMGFWPIIEYLEAKRCDEDNKHFLRRNREGRAILDKYNRYMCVNETTKWSTIATCNVAEYHYNRFVHGKLRKFYVDFV